MKRPCRSSRKTFGIKVLEEDLEDTIHQYKNKIIEYFKEKYNQTLTPIQVEEIEAVVTPLDDGEFLYVRFDSGFVENPNYILEI